MTKTCHHLKKRNITYFGGMLSLLQKVTKRYTQIHFFSPRILLHHLGSEGRASCAIKLTSVSHMLIKYLHPSSALSSLSHTHTHLLNITCLFIKNDCSTCSFNLVRNQQLLSNSNSGFSDQEYTQGPGKTFTEAWTAAALLSSVLKLTTSTNVQN